MSSGSGKLKEDGSGGNSNNTNSADFRYCYDNEKLQKLRSTCPWMKDPKYFEKVALSPSAIMKIIMHCQSGVVKGIGKGGNPIEVMGMLLGRPDPDTPTTLVVTDAFPLPIEGFETRVIADDENVVNHMIELGEALEKTRKEKFMGWYHSHPFDIIPDQSHCFLSQTDLSTQLQWQRAEDPHGNPFVAIVVDPLRSIHLQAPQLKAFRAYPPEYNSPTYNECPDGSIQSSEQVRLERWGSCWNRYYELNIEYYMSHTSRTILEQLTQDYLWMRTLCKTETDITQQLIQSNKSMLNAASASGGGPGEPGGGTLPGGGAGTTIPGIQGLQQASGAASAGPSAAASAALASRVLPRGARGSAASAASSGSAIAEPGLTSQGSENTKSSSTSTNKTANPKLTKAVQSIVDIASEQIRSQALEKTKQQVFAP